MASKIAESFGGVVSELVSPNHIKLGDTLTFRAVATSLDEFDLADWEKQYKIISVVPSVDTPVCSTQTKHLEELLTKEVNQNTVGLITISNDLPFAQGRSCSFVKESSGHKLLSDYLYHDFAANSGLLMKANGLLARAVIILDEHNRVIFISIPTPVTTPIDFAALRAKLVELRLLNS